MKTAIQFGAGNIGRGFIGMLLAQAGYRVIFADVSEVIIDRLAADQKYTVHVMDTEVEDVEITNITGIMSNGEAIIDEIAKADILTTAVGLRVLGFIAPTIAKGIQKRIADLQHRAHEHHRLRECHPRHLPVEGTCIWYPF